MRTTRTDIKILTDLYKAVDGLTPYVFYQRYKFGPSVVYKSTSKLLHKGLIVNEEDRFSITPTGKEFVEKNRFLFDKDTFARLPKEFVIPKLAVNQPYIPNIAKLSKEILNLQNQGDG